VFDDERLKSPAALPMLPVLLAVDCEVELLFGCAFPMRLDCELAGVLLLSFEALASEPVVPVLLLLLLLLLLSLSFRDSIFPSIDFFMVVCLFSLKVD